MFPFGTVKLVGQRGGFGARAVLEERGFFRPVYERVGAVRW